MKKILLFILFVFMTFSGFCQIKNVEEFREKKITFYCEKDFSKVVNEIDKELSLLEANKASYTLENYLTIKNFLLVDKSFFSLEHNEMPKSKKDYFKDVLLAQDEACENFLKGKDLKNVSSGFLVSFGDLRSQLTYVIAIPKAIPKLVKSKEYYETAVENDPSSCAALISKALWYEYSPAISGGSHKKALEIINQAEKAATTQGDRFFSLMFKGQILNSLKKYDESMAAFRTAHNLYPSETFTAIMAENLEIEMDF